MKRTTGKTIAWGIILLLAMFAVVTPLGLLTANFILIPILIMAVVSDRLRFAIVYGAAVVIPAVLLGRFGLFLSLIALFYLPTALAMAWQYRRGRGAGTAVIAGIVTLIATTLVGLLATLALGFNLSEFMRTSVESEAGMAPLLQAMLGASADKVDEAIQLLISMLPVTIISFTLYTVVVSHFFARKLFAHYGFPAPKLKPMKDWRLPRSIIWYYFIFLLINLFFQFKTGSTMYVVMLNAAPLLTYALALQGVGFLFFTADAKGWNRALPITGLVLLPFFPQFIAWIGILDIAIPWRSRMKPHE